MVEEEVEDKAEEPDLGGPDEKVSENVAGPSCLQCENYAVVPSFSSNSLYLCKTSCPKHNIKLHNYALTITTTTCGMCLWSRYPVLVIIRELEVLTSRPSIAS